VCIAADRASLPEAGGGLAVLLDPIDRSCWSTEILHWWTDDTERQRLEGRIAAEYQRVTPADTVNALLVVSGLSGS
jgi:hypothetical protein